MIEPIAKRDISKEDLELYQCGYFEVQMIEDGMLATYQVNFEEFNELVGDYQHCEGDLVSMRYAVPTMQNP